jgi:hypothetical protein
VSAIAEQLYGAQIFDLLDYACAEFPILDPEHALTRMLVALKQCSATTDLGFRKWAHAFIRTMADDIVRDQVSSFDEVIKIAQERDTEPKPPFISEQHPTRPEITFVKIERGRDGRDSSIWIVPTDKLPLVQILHPTVAVKFMRVGNQRNPYLIKKCQRQSYNGSWHTVVRDLGAIWLGIDKHFKSYEAKDGNYLNFLPDNLQPYRLPYRDAFNSAYFGLFADDCNPRPEDWVPERSTPKTRTNYDGGSVEDETFVDLKAQDQLSDHADSVKKMLHAHDDEPDTPKFKAMVAQEARVRALVSEPEPTAEPVQSDTDLSAAVQKLKEKWGCM